VFKWFLWHAGLLEEALDYRVHEEGLSIHNYEVEVFRKTPGYTGQIAAAIEAGAPIINFLRCPYSRAFSSYMHLQNRFFVRFERDGIRHAGLDLRYEILRSIYGKVTPVEYPVSFMDYLLWLDAHNVEEVEVHHASQYTPLYDLPNVPLQAGGFQPEHRFYRAQILPARFERRAHKIFFASPPAESRC